MKKHIKIIYSLFILLNFHWFTLYGQNIPEKIEFANVQLVIQPDAVEEIKKNINIYTQNDKFLQPIVDRTDTYFPIIERILSEEKIPDDFKYLVLQESKLLVDAQSSSFAEGFWQMKKETAESLGLKVTLESDERKHIILSTYAAARYLKKNNETFNNWIYTLLSYNLGLSGTVQSVDYKYYSARKMEINSKTHWYIIKAISTKLAFQNLLNKNPDPKVMLFEYKALKGQTFDEIARINKVELNILVDYNKWFKGFKIPGDKDYIVIIPLLRDQGEGNPVPRELYASNPNPVLLTKNGLKAIQAKIGDTYEKLAKDGGVKLEQLNEFNELNPLTPLYYGQICYLEKKHPQPHEYLNPYHTFAYGQTLWSISQDYGVQSTLIRKFNNLKLPTDLYPGEEPKIGQKLWLRENRPESQGVEISVKEEENFSVDQQDLFQKDVKDTAGLKNMKYVPANSKLLDDSNELKNTLEVSPSTNQQEIIKPKANKPKTPDEEAAEEYERQIIAAQKKKETKKTPSVEPRTPAPPPSPSPALPVAKEELKKEIKKKEQVLEPGAKYHEWKYGESLFDIAKKNNCTTKQLLIWNDLSANAFEVGTKLIIRTTAVTKNEALGKPLFHIVKPQETLWKLSVLYSSTLAQLTEWNHLSGTILEVGQKLKVSEGNETEIPLLLATNLMAENLPGYHTVQQGENLFRISLLYKVPVTTLEQMNNLSSQRVYIGQKIRIAENSGKNLIDNSLPISKNTLKNTGEKEKTKEFDKTKKNPSPSKETGGETQTHTVSKGETLFSVSKKYSVSVEQLKSWNNLRDNSISVDQQILISDPKQSKRVIGNRVISKTPEPPQETKQFHIVKPKETLFGIAKMYNVKMEQLKLWNGLKNNEIAIGEQLIVSELVTKKALAHSALPISPSPALSTSSHTVAQGENLAMIANKYKVSVMELKQWNNLKNLVVTKGQTLIVSRPGESGSGKLGKDINGSMGVSEPKKHTVEKGETVQSIIKMYKITLPDLKKWNTMTSPKITLGQTLIVSDPALFIKSEPQESAGSSSSLLPSSDPNNGLASEPDFTKGPNQKQLYYTVKEKESIYQIANNFKINVSDIMRINNLSTYEINPGQRLLITYYDEEKLEYLTHTVLQGETLYSIAQKYECKVSEIMGWNMKTQIDIKPGDQLKIRKKE